MQEIHGPDGPLGSAERNKYVAALAGSTHSHVVARLLDRSRKPVANLPVVVDGERTIDTEAEVLSSISCTIQDTRKRLILGTNALFLDRLLQLVHVTWIPELGIEGRVAFFTGPCSAPEWEGSTIYLEAQGMELWAMGSVRSPRTFPKGAIVTEVIRDLMLTGVGEAARFLSIPRRPDRLPAEFTVALDDTWWNACQYLAESIDCDLFYDYGGLCVLRPRPTQLVHTFTGDHLLAYPRLGVLIGSERGGDVTAIRNRFVTVGQGKPNGDGEAPQIVGIWNVPNGNRFSAVSLGHPGHPLWLKDVVTNDLIRLKSTAVRFSRNRGRRSLQQAQRNEMRTRMFPHIDPYDRYGVTFEDTPPGPFEHLSSSTPIFPTIDAPQTWGSTRRVAA